MERKSAGLLMYRRRDRHVEVLLIHPGGPFWARKDDGAWCIPKGEFTDEEPLEAAQREFQEETGLTAQRFWVVPFVNSFYVASNDTVHISPFFAVEVELQDQPRLSHEHEDFAWCALEEAGKRLVWPGQRQGLQIVHDYIVGEQEASRLLSLSV